MKTNLCAGLTWNGACARREQCGHLGHWWLQDGVKFNRCGSDGNFKHFLAVATIQAAAAARPQQELFA